MLKRLALAAIVVLAAPASADAKCGVKPASALYETPEVQVYTGGGSLTACRRASGKGQAIGRSYSSSQDSAGDYAYHATFNAVLGRRWVWVTQHDYDEGVDSYYDTLSDLRTGKVARVVWHTSNTDVPDAQVIALPGALVATIGGVQASFPDGSVQQLSTDATAVNLASRGNRVYWTVAGVAQTAVLTLPAADAPRALPRATKLGHCKPRAGAKLVERSGSLVVTRAGGAVWACNSSRQRRLGAVDDVAVVSDRAVTYARAGSFGVFDASSGTRTELAGMQAATAGAALLVSGPAGLRTPTAVLSPDPASEPALGNGQAYWLDGTGAPHTVAL